MENLHTSLVGRQLLAVLSPVREQFSAAHDLHAASAGTEEGQHGLWQSAGSLAYGDGLVVAGQVVYLYHHQTVVLHQASLLVPVLVFGGKAQTGQADATFEVCLHPSIVLARSTHQVVNLAQTAHGIGQPAVGYHPDGLRQLYPVNDFGVPVRFQ